MQLIAEPLSPAMFWAPSFGQGNLGILWKQEMVGAFYPCEALLPSLTLIIFRVIFFLYKLFVPGCPSGLGWASVRLVLCMHTSRTDLVGY